MRLDDAMEIKVAQPDSQYCLIPCKCGSDNVGYVLYMDQGQELWRAQCFDCGRCGQGDQIRHEAQLAWNKEVDMKHGKNPTREQKKLISKWKLDPAVWLVVKDTPREMVLVHRHSDRTTKTIPKGDKGQWLTD